MFVYDICASLHRYDTYALCTNHNLVSLLYVELNVSSVLSIICTCTYCTVRHIRSYALVVTVVKLVRIPSYEPHMTSLKNLVVLGSDGLGLLVSLCIHT